MQENSIIFTVVDSPTHGSIEHLQNSVWGPTTVFSMDEIYENKVSYLHDGSESFIDKFTFTVSDGTNSRFAISDREDSAAMPVEQSTPLVNKIFD